jgi:hypothetical protein
MRQVRKRKIWRKQRTRMKAEKSYGKVILKRGEGGKKVW